MNLIGIVSNSICNFCSLPSVWFLLYLDVGFNCVDDFKFGVGSILVPALSMRVFSLFDTGVLMLKNDIY